MFNVLPKIRKHLCTYVNNKKVSLARMYRLKFQTPESDPLTHESGRNADGF